MSTKENLETMAKNTWLAGLGSIDSSKEALGKSIDAAQEKSNSLYNELLTRGEEIQSKINEKRDELRSKGKKLFSLPSTKSHDEKIAQLNAKVDQLTTAVVALIEKRNAQEAKPKRVAAKTKTAAKPKASASTTKAKAAAKPKAAATKAKTPAKPKASATKAKPAAKAKATATKAATKTKTSASKSTTAASTDAKKAD